MKLRFSIRYKILSMVTLLLVGAIGFYLLLAMKIFEQDKQELVFDLNKSVVTTTAAQVDSTLRGVADKMRLYAVSYGESAQAHSAFKEILSGDPYLVRVELFEMGASRKMSLLTHLSDSEFVKLYGLDEKFFDTELAQARPIPFDKIHANATYVWNATIENGPALIAMGLPVIREGARGVPEKLMAVVGYIKADIFINNLKSSSVSQTYIIGSDGHVLMHPSPKVMIGSPDVSGLAIVKQLKTAQLPIGVMEYDVHGERELGAYARVRTGDLGIVSQVESSKAFAAVHSLVRRSILFALMISTFTFIVTVFVSRSLTRPLQRLMAAMENVSDGKLDVEVKVKSHDEIAVLANSFNRMTHDLKTSREQLEEINRELENKVVDRTKKLEEQNRAVKEAQEALLRTTRLASVGEIAGRTAHEVLNPLTSLMARVQKVQKRVNEEVYGHKNLLGEIVKAWRAEMSEKGVDAFLKSLQEPSAVDPKQTLLQEDLTNINEIFTRWDSDLSTLEKDTQFLLQQAGRIDKILRQMRALSVVSSSRSRVHVHPVLHDAINILGDLFIKNKIEVTEEFEAASDESRLDRDEMIQVLTNLLRNSLQAITESKTPGARHIKIKTSNGDGKLVIDITDSGMGIVAENQQKLFESQFSTKSPDLGTGLGLSISRRFVRAWDGDLFLLKSTPGEGTTFRMELPLHAEIANKVAKGAAA